MPVLTKGDKLRIRVKSLRPIGFFFLLLLFWEFVQAIGWVVSIRWIVLHQVEMGTACITQGEPFPSST
jgi:hypothetical protein